MLNLRLDKFQYTMLIFDSLWGTPITLEISESQSLAKRSSVMWDEIIC